MSARHTDPLGKRALFDSPPAAAPDQLAPGAPAGGHTALYSTGARRCGTVVVVCSSCGVHARVSLLELATRLVPLTAWVPLVAHGHLLRCPGCERRRWCCLCWRR